MLKFKSETADNTEISEITLGQRITSEKLSYLFLIFMVVCCGLDL